MSATDGKADSRQSVKVTIFNQSFTLLSQGDAAELLQIANEVDDLMHSISERSGSTDSSRVAVLACLHMADRMRALEAITTQVNDRAAEFSELLEQALLPD